MIICSLKCEELHSWFDASFFLDYASDLSEVISGNEACKNIRFPLPERGRVRMIVQIETYVHACMHPFFPLRQTGVSESERAKKRDYPFLLLLSFAP